MNRKLKMVLRRRSSEQGFAMPIAVGLGLIMILVGITMIIRAQGDQVTASAQKATAQSLGTTETGITRVQSLMNIYRIINNITLTNINSTTTNWSRVYDASPPNCSTSGATLVSSYRINDWITLDNGGQFRIKEYRYRPNSDNAKITGSFIIPAIGSVLLSNPPTSDITPPNYLIDNDSVEGQIQGIAGILSRKGTKYTFRRLVPVVLPDIITSDTFFSPGPSDFAQITATTIPASGAVTITPVPATYLLNGASAEGQIEGIQGTLFRNVLGVYTFERLISGTATNVTGNFFPTRTPGTGTLRLESRVNQAGTGSTATQTVGTANTQLVVSIPIMQMDINSLPVPGAWLKSGTMSGQQKIQGNLLLNDCDHSTISPTTHQALSGGTPFVDPVTGMAYKTLQVDSVFPPLPRKPIFNTLPNHILGPLTSSQTFPRTGDISNTGVVYPAIGGKFEYSVASADGNSNITITIPTTPGLQVRFYLDGNIGKKAEFIHDCTGIPGCNAADFEIFGYGGSNSTICLNGNGLIDGFIYAPAYRGGVDGNGQIRGSVWFDKFDAPSCSSDSNQIVVDQTANWTTLGVKPRNLPSTLAPVTSWLRQEVSP